MCWGWGGATRSTLLGWRRKKLQEFHRASSTANEGVQGADLFREKERTQAGRKRSEDKGSSSK